MVTANKHFVELSDDEDEDLKIPPTPTTTVAKNARKPSQQTTDMSKPPRKWLMDRVNGTSKYNDGDRPCCPCCWVPPPVLLCPGLFEDNCFCRFWGFVGCFEGETSRFCLMHAGFLFNLCACLLTIYACLAITVDFDLLTKTSFGSVELTEVNGKFSEPIQFDIGLRAVALNNQVTGVGEVVVRFEDFCALADDGLERYLSPEDCAACDDISSSMVISTILAAVTFLPSFATDVLRMYSGYDVNCQKCFATIFAFLTVLLSLNTILSYNYLCADKFYDGIIPFDDSGNALPSDTPVDDADLLVKFQYKHGWGMIFLFAGTALKFADIFLHVCLRTPNVTRDIEEQRIYEKVKEEI